MEAFPMMRTPGEREATEEQKILSLCHKGLTRLPPLGLFPWARILDLRGNRLLKLEGLEAATWVEELRVGQNRLVTLQGLAHLPMLRAVNANDNSIVQISGLEGCSMLELLYLHNNNISSIDGVHSLTRLCVLDLSCNHISTLPDLASCHSLRILDLSGNFLSSLAPAPDCLPPGIQNLSLADNEIEEFADLKYLTTSTGLLELHLSGNPIAAIATGRGIDIQPLVLFLLPRLGYLNGTDLQRNGGALMISRALFTDVKGELSDDLLQLMGNGRQMDLIAYLVAKCPASRPLRPALDSGNSNGAKNSSPQVSSSHMGTRPGSILGNGFSNGPKELWGVELENQDPAPVGYRNPGLPLMVRKGLENAPLTSNSGLANGTLMHPQSGSGTPLRSYEQVPTGGEVTQQDLLDGTAPWDARNLSRSRTSGRILWRGGGVVQMATNNFNEEAMAVDARESSESFSSTGWHHKQDRTGGADMNRQSMESSMTVDGSVGPKNGVMLRTTSGMTASGGGLPDGLLETMGTRNEGPARVGAIKMVIDNLKNQVHDLQKAIDQLQGPQSEKGNVSPARDISEDNPRFLSGKSSLAQDIFDDMKPGTPDRQQELPPSFTRTKGGVLTSESSDISRQLAYSQDLSICRTVGMNKSSAEEIGKISRYATLEWVAGQNREAVPLADVLKLGYKKEHNVAAAKIQAWVVGNQVRARLARYHREQQAATSIQAVWRGVVTRLKRQRSKVTTGIPRNLLQRLDLDAEASVFQRAGDSAGPSPLAREGFEKRSQLVDAQSGKELEALVRSVISDINRLREQYMTLETKVALATDNRAFLEQVVRCLWDEMRAFRRWRDRCVLKEQGVAVIVIQRWWRGHQGRREVAKMKAEIQFQEEQYLRRVTMIQANIRKYLQRKRFLQHLTEKKAAIKIQAAIRGYLARKHYNKLLAENQVEGLIKDVILLREEVDATRRWVMALAAGFDPSSTSPKRVSLVEGRSRIDDTTERDDPAPSILIGCHENYSRFPPHVVAPLPSDLLPSTSVTISPVGHNHGFASTGVPPPSPSSSFPPFGPGPHVTSEPAWSRGGDTRKGDCRHPSEPAWSGGVDMHKAGCRNPSSGGGGVRPTRRAVEERRSYCCCVCHLRKDDDHGVSSSRGNLKRRMDIRDGGGGGDGGDAGGNEDGNNANATGWLMLSPRGPAPSKWAKVSVAHSRHDGWQGEKIRHHQQEDEHNQSKQARTGVRDVNAEYGFELSWNCSAGDDVCRTGCARVEHESEVPLVNIGDDGMDSQDNCAANGLEGSDESGTQFLSAGSGEDADGEDGDGESLLGNTPSFNHEQQKKNCTELPTWLQVSQRGVQKKVENDLQDAIRKPARLGSLGQTATSSTISGGPPTICDTATASSRAMDRESASSIAMDREWVSIIDNRVFAFANMEGGGGGKLVQERWGEGAFSPPGCDSVPGLVGREWSGSDGDNQMDEYCCGSFPDSDDIKGDISQWLSGCDTNRGRNGGGARDGEPRCDVDVQMRGGGNCDATGGGSEAEVAGGVLSLPHGALFSLNMEEEERHNKVREQGVRETYLPGHFDKQNESSSDGPQYLRRSRIGDFELCEYNSDTSTSSYCRSSLGRERENGGGLFPNRNGAATANGGPRRGRKTEKCARRAGILQIVTLRRRAAAVISRSQDVKS